MRYWIARLIRAIRDEIDRQDEAARPPAAPLHGMSFEEIADPLDRRYAEARAFFRRRAREKIVRTYDQISAAAEPPIAC